MSRQHRHLAILLAFALLPQLTPAQADPPPSAKLIEEGQKEYAKSCAGCHGAQAEGSDRAPQLAGSRRLRTRSLQQVRGTIYDGVPSSGMPSFHLPDEELDALTAFVYSLNTAASKAWTPGSAAVGERYFFGAGECTSCHMVSGKGKPIGPDLSNVANEMTISELKDALLHPDAHITPGYDLLTVKLRNGQSIRGFARGRTNFDLQLQDLDGNFLLLQQPQIEAVQEEKQSVMKPLHLQPEPLQDLIAFLCTLGGIPARPASVDPPPEPSGVTFERIQNPRPGDWLTYNGKLSGNRYSELTQINAGNVGKLAVKWMFPINHYGIETTPVVADDIMYVTGPNQAWALDALTGRSIWHYARPRSTGLVGDASVGTNRGMAILGDKVFMVMDNAHLIALNRITGHLVWDVFMPEEPQHYGSTVSPLIVKDKVIAGVSGGDWGMRGFVACFKASTGQLLWRRWTIPLNGEPGSETWKGKPPLFGGGSTWLTGAYDPQTDTLYWPTGNPWPDSDDRDRPGDNLYTNSILALNPGNGEMKWHYQFTPHDTHDWDATEPPVLIDTQYEGKPRKLLLHADRNGIFYVLDRTNGKVLLTKQFTHRLTWTDGIGPDGRPRPVPPNGNVSRGTVCPTDAANWDSAAFSPTTRLYYVLTMEQCRNEQRTGTLKGQEPVVPAAQKYLRAINIDTGKVAWEIPQIGTVLPKTWPGVLGTAGGVIFYGDPNGTFVAAGEREGKTLWHFDTNVLMKASPMTYMVDGKQFVAVAAGPNILCFGLP